MGEVNLLYYPSPPIQVQAMGEVDLLYYPPPPPLSINLYFFEGLQPIKLISKCSYDNWDTFPPWGHFQKRQVLGCSHLF